MEQRREKVGFIGIGLMGAPMTMRLLAAGYSVTVWNRTRSKLNAVVEAGAQTAASIAELVEASDIILLSLTDSTAVEEVVLAYDGVARSGAAGKVLVDLSSIAPDTTRILAGRLANDCDMAWVDAPVSGGVVGAQQGTLVIMVGGSVEAVDRVRPVLSAFSQRVTRMGDVGAGQVTKICNQMIVSCNALVIAEMIALAERSGVDAGLIPEALSGGFADSKPLQFLAGEMANSQFEPIKWRVKTLLKDLDMATDLAHRQGSAIPISALAAQLMRQHGGRGFLEQDPATLIKLYRQEHSDSS